MTLLEPFASGALIQHYVALRHHQILPLLRIYVDSHLPRVGRLVRFIRHHIFLGNTASANADRAIARREHSAPAHGRLTGASLLYVPPSSPDLTLPRECANFRTNVSG